MSTNLALGLVNQTAGIVGENISQTLTGLSEMIGQDALNLKVNKGAAVTLSVRIKDLVAAINDALEVQDGETLKPAWVHALASFNRVLNDAQVALDKLQRKSHIMQLLHQKKDADMLKELSDRVSNAFGLLKLRVNIDMATNADTIHRVLDSTATALANLEAEPLPPTAGRLPSPPPAYVGRTLETATIVEMLSGPDQAFIAVLGGPGLGKTSVAVAALHAAEVEIKFTSHRYFIACDAADGLSSLLTTLCTGLGIQFESPKSAQKALQRFLTKAPCLLLLDNFESVWEATSTRQKTEDLLSVLASLSTVSILVTLRGSELPASISWTHPLLPPLQPLHTDAAVQLFLSIADKGNDEKELLQLLCVLDNIPLAVVLMANLAQWQSLQELIEQWEEIKTSMLQRSHGNDHLTSLDVSIGLSLASPRMLAVPHAQILLSLLALLPAGVSEADLTAWASLVDCRHSVSVLLQTSLAYHTSPNKIYVLAPIREFMLHHHPPETESLYVLTGHYFALPHIVVEDRSFQPVNAAAVQLIISEMPNIYSVISWCFIHLKDVHKSLSAAYSMMVFYYVTGLGSPDLLGRALSIAQSLNLLPHIADLTFTLASFVFDSRTTGNALLLCTTAQTLYRELGDTLGLIQATIGSHRFMSPKQNIASCRDLCTLAETSGSDVSVYQTYYSLAIYYRQMGQIEDARHSYTKAAHALQKLGPKGHWRLGHLLFHIADLEANLGNIPTAVIQMEEAIHHLEAFGNYGYLWDAQRLFAEVLICQGHLIRASELASTAVLNSHATDDQGSAIACSRDIIMIHLYTDNGEAATSVINKIQQVPLHPDSDRYTIAQSIFMQASAAILYWQGELDHAGAVLVTALQITQKQVVHWLRQNQVYEVAEVLSLLGQVEHAQGHLNTAASYFITAVAAFRHLPVQYKLVPALVHLAQVLDDETSESLLNAVMPPLKRWNFRPSYAEALLHSARIALRRNQLQTARHRVRNALHYFEEINSARECKRARAFLEECG